MYMLFWKHFYNCLNYTIHLYLKEPPCCLVNRPAVLFKPRYIQIDRNVLVQIFQTNSKLKLNNANHISKHTYCIDLMSGKQFMRKRDFVLDLGLTPARKEETRSLP